MQENVHVNVSRCMFGGNGGGREGGLCEATHTMDNRYLCRLAAKPALCTCTCMHFTESLMRLNIVYVGHLHVHSYTPAFQYHGGKMGYLPCCPPPPRPPKYNPPHHMCTYMDVLSSSLSSVTSIEHVPSIYPDDYTDDLLSAHESELDRMRGFYSDNNDTFKLVEKRENLWNKLQEFEVIDF